MKISVIVPVFNEEESLPQLVSEIHEALVERYSFEIVAVDDGSKDGSREVLKKLSREYEPLVVVELRRNFGQSAALQAGIDHASGDVIALMDADLQNDPRDIPRMLEILEQGHDLVAGWRADRKDRFLNRRLPSILANSLISATTKVKLHDYGCTLKLIRADLAKELRLYGEMHRFIPALAAFIGARIIETKVNHRARKFGVSKYGIGRTLRVILDLITVIFLKSYLVRPMQVFGLAGLICFVTGFGVALYLSLQKLIWNTSLSDRPLLLFAALMILVGVQLLSLGLVADVVARTYHEAQNRKAYFVRSSNRFESEETFPSVVKKKA